MLDRAPYCCLATRPALCHGSGATLPFSKKPLMVEGVSHCSVPGVCNAYLPEDTTLNRFMWVVNYFAQQGFYLILDNQFNLDQTATQNTQQWLDRVGTTSNSN